MNNNINVNYNECDLRYKIIDFVNMIGNHNKEVEYVKELSNGFIISGGLDNNLIIYDNETFSKTFEIKDFKDWPNNIYEIINKEEKGDNNLEIIVCCKNEIHFVLLDTEELRFNIYKKQLKDISTNICLEIGKNNYIISGENGVYLLSNLIYNSEQFWTTILIKEPLKGGMYINNNIIALTSNSIFPNTRDKLLFYNYNTKKISKIVNGYSFINTQNGLSLFNLNEEKKILLCACKKYLSDQKNGILLVNPDLEDNQEVIDPFYDTDDFEVYCFCQLYLNDNKTYSNYFLAGGFEHEMGEGVIKIFKLISSEKVFDTKIEYILDIVFDFKENFEGFERPISSIIQSKKNGNIIVSCWDGNVYLLTPPNLDYLLLYDNLSEYNEELGNAFV